MGKATFWYNARDRRWEIRNRAGSPIATWTDDGYNKDYEGRVVVGVASLADARITRALLGGGATLSLLTKLNGTLPALAVGTGLTSVGTVTGQGSAGIAVGDLVFVNPKAALPGNLGIAGVRVPTTNVINVFVSNTVQNDIGSLPHTGVDVLQIRLAG